MVIGVGMLKGLGVTLRTFLGTYPWGRAILRAAGVRPGDGLVTVQYPDVKQQHSERFRYFPFLVYDGAPDNLRCVACKICEQECPPQCIHITMAKDAQGRPLKARGRTLPEQFDIDVSICMSCRICVDVCPFDAIEMDQEYELSSGENRREDMSFTKARLLKSNEYFRSIHPTEAAAVDQRLAATRAKASDAKASEPKAAPAPETPPEA